MNDARVVCRELGFPGARRSHYRYKWFRRTSVLGGVRCNGSESSVLDCRRDDLRNDDCKSYAAWVWCDTSGERSA